MNRVGPQDVVDMFVVAVVVYELIKLVQHSRSSSVLKGLMLILAAVVVSNLFGLTALGWMMNNILANGTVVLIVLFQPELRKALEKLGSGTQLENRRSSEEENQRIVDELVHLCLRLSQRRVGMLIVFEHKTGLADVIETGTLVNARISSALLENIFEPNTPLHDGAVIIRGSEIVAGACILPLTESLTVSRDLGTRHRAAIGITETTDATALIVSEETGIISVARGGKLTRHLDESSLRVTLGSMYRTRRKLKPNDEKHRVVKAARVKKAPDRKGGGSDV